MWIGLFLVVFHFVVPFLLLLSRDLKRNPKLIRTVAAWVFCLRLVDLFWMTGPNFMTAPSICIGSISPRRLVSVASGSRRFSGS